MDGRGDCCIARYDGGAYDTSKIDRIMLRFRPIAPKPAVSGGGSVSGGSSPEKNDFLYKTGRAKRKYVRDGSSTRRCSRKKKTVSVSGSEQRKDGVNEDAVVTLPLLPENPVEKDTPTTRSLSDTDLTAGTKPPLVHVATWLNSRSINGPAHQEGTIVMRQPVRPVGSCVIVECVTDACGGDDGSVGLGRGDGEKRSNLERDTCPGLISDGWDRVEWTNAAYRKMVNQDEGDDDQVRPEMVLLVVKERLPEKCAAFTCRVRVQYTCGKERYSLTVPCDVWRMNCGGLAWRLDVKAALSLGR